MRSSGPVILDREEIFMPDLDELNQEKQGQKSITMEWLQSRSKGLPADVPFK
jgi:hypothetical protein